MNKNFFRRYFYILLAVMTLFCQTVRANGPIVLKKGDSKAEEQSADSDTEANPYAGRLKDAKEAIRKKDVGRYGMVPIYPKDVVDGSYDIQVDSSSPFFKITAAELLVDGEEMSARITISSLSYLYVYMGTAQEAEKDENNRIDRQEEGGKSIFTVPVEALNKEIDCAAFSKNRQIWYDRKLVFNAESLPADVLRGHIALPYRCSTFGLYGAVRLH